MSSNLRPLLDILTKNVEILENSCRENGTNIPDLITPFHPSSEAFREHPDAAEASNIIVAAAHQLAAILTPPPIALYHIVGGFLKSAAVRVCLESNVTEILRDAGPQGMHVNDIGKKNGMDPKKLSRFLRILATHHIYKELTPDVFTNTRISSLMDTLKSIEAILSDPENKHKDTMGLAALASHHLDEPFKAGAYVWETCSNPESAHSSEPTASAFARSIGSAETVWQFYDRPSERFRQARFGFGMRGVNALQSPDAILKAYDWKKLPSGSLVVDVGGGIGSVTHNILKSFPDLRFVVQDLPAVIKDGKKANWWESEMPQAISSGQTVLQVHDFFAPQPQKHTTIFMIKQILHDWSDDYCVKILKNLRAAAAPDTTLLILESIIPYACHDPSADDNKGIPGAVPQEAPAPLIANYGAANEMGFLSDMIMSLLFNSQERTVHHFDRLLASTGWKLKIVNRKPGDSTYMQSMEAVPL
ncbi:S-adenosyl-L-methionine-dependent methyltransferase [Marasmius fiardii PR-910]|nr:S-adenosyl-L-methionine-dependent methyltransferase [Marasmius fiardii PR-910]